MKNRLILGLCLTLQLIYATDSQAYKSQLEVTLGTWDLAYRYQLTDRLSARIKGSWTTDKGEGTRFSYYYQDSTDYDRSTSMNRFQVELAGLYRVGRVHGVTIDLGVGVRKGQDFFEYSELSVEEQTYLESVIMIRQTHTNKVDDRYDGLAGMVLASYDITPRIGMLIELAYHIEKHEYENFQKVTTTYSDIWPEPTDTKSIYKHDETLHGLEAVKIGLAFRF